jgi:hypothetical protein
MSRAMASWILCLLTLGVGLYTAVRSVQNRARGAGLDQLERENAARSRQNELRRAELIRREWELLTGVEEDLAARIEAVRP